MDTFINKRIVWYSQVGNIKFNSYSASVNCSSLTKKGFVLSIKTSKNLNTVKINWQELII